MCPVNGGPSSELIEYSEEYMDESKIHYYSPNRKNHFPYIYKVSLLAGDIEKVKKLFIADAKLRRKKANANLEGT